MIEYYQYFLGAMGWRAEDVGFNDWCQRQGRTISSLFCWPFITWWPAALFTTLSIIHKQV